MSAKLQPRVSSNARVQEIERGWRLSLVANQSKYALAQLDNYSGIPRRKFPHHPPFEFTLRARASHAALPGTWGFGLWNDPFGFSLGFGGAGRLPALPNAAWFFFASPHSHLALRDDLPGSGLLAATFRAPRIPSLALAPAALALPLLAARPLSRALRNLAARVIAQDSVALDLDPTAWHEFKISWNADTVEFFVDNASTLTTAISPQPPLSLVIWLDNQYAAWRPNGSFTYGVLPTQDSWIEIQDLRLN